MLSSSLLITSWAQPCKKYMREIKFRVWNKIDKVLTQPHSINDEILDNKDILEVMQYTGLKDKNGKEIYEGDILTADYCSIKRAVKRGFIPKPIKIKGKVYWRDACFAIDAPPIIYLLSDVYIPKYYKTIEVIGNIYQNPELLNNK